MAFINYFSTLIFHRAFVPNSICCPARANVLTAKYSHMNGQMGNSEKFDGSQQTLPKLMQAAGYETAIIATMISRTRTRSSDTTVFVLSDIS